jgi:thiol-disulfide isomerase/thioredoxin
MRAILLIVFCLLAANISAQEKFKKEIVGPLDQKVFTQDEEIKKWFPQGKNEYQPKPEVIKTLEKKFGDKKIVVVMGTWCSDSQREVPRLFKILELAGADTEKLLLYGVDKNKKRPRSIIHKYHIANVPTIIIFDNSGKEMGRIIEHPVKSLGEDLAAIVN